MMMVSPMVLPIKAREIGEFPDLLFPIGFQRSGAGDENTLNVPELAQDLGGSDGLNGLAEA